MNKQRKHSTPEKKVAILRRHLGYVDHSNNVRLNSATGYVTPKDMLAGRQEEIHRGAGPEVGRSEATSDSPPAGR